MPVPIVRARLESRFDRPPGTQWTRRRDIGAYSRLISQHVNAGGVLGTKPSRTQTASACLDPSASAIGLSRSLPNVPSRRGVEANKVANVACTASPCLGSVDVTPWQVRLEFPDCHYITVSSPLRGVGGFNS